MIEPVPGWSWEVTSTGSHLVPPEGTAYGFVVYQEWSRRCFDDFSAACTAMWPTLRPKAALRPARRAGMFRPALPTTDDVPWKSWLDTAEILGNRLEEQAAEVAPPPKWLLDLF